MVPDLRELPVGCRFQDRCPYVIERCRQEEPELLPIAGLGGERRSRCFRASEIGT
jgi:peptide/nickel transport system ATP-binding protein